MEKYNNHITRIKGLLESRKYDDVVNYVQLYYTPKWENLYVLSTICNFKQKPIRALCEMYKTHFFGRYNYAAKLK